MSNHTTYSVYRIVCFATGKVYIGQTYNTDARKRQHFNKLKRNKHTNPHLQNAFNLYGAKQFFFEILETDLSYKDANHRERYWIDHFDSRKNGFNMTEGGNETLGLVNQKPCTWNGIEYESVVKCALANNVPTPTMQFRLKKGYSNDNE